MVEKVRNAIEALKEGKMILLTDDHHRENEADLIFPAENITADVMNFMIRHGSGIVCVATTESHLKRLGLPLLFSPDQNNTQQGTPFAMAVDAKEGISTGVSVHDRVKTIQVMMDPQATPQDLVRPGHMYPLQAREGGVLERGGHTEGSVDIVRLAGLQSAAVICEVMNPDGTMMRGEALKNFANAYALPMLSIQELKHYRLFFEDQIKARSETPIALAKFGEFTLHAWQEKYFPYEHLGFFKPPVDPHKPALIRIHSSCATGDIFGSEHCDCQAQLHYSLKRIQEEGGWLFYLDQEGRGIGLFNKVKAYALQQEGYDTAQANEALGLPVDAREYYIPAQIVREMDLHSIRLLTNNPQKALALSHVGVDVIVETLPVFANACNCRYLKTKKEKLFHAMNF